MVDKQGSWKVQRGLMTRASLLLRLGETSGDQGTNEVCLPVAPVELAGRIQRKHVFWRVLEEEESLGRVGLLIPWRHRERECVSV